MKFQCENNNSNHKNIQHKQNEMKFTTIRLDWRCHCNKLKTYFMLMPNAELFNSFVYWTNKNKKRPFDLSRLLKFSCLTSPLLLLLLLLLCYGYLHYFFLLFGISVYSFRIRQFGAGFFLSSNAHYLTPPPM